MKVYVFFLSIIVIFKSCELIEIPVEITEIIDNSAYSESHVLRKLIQKQIPVQNANNSNNACVAAIVELLEDDLNQASLKFLDAWGKIPSGIFYGHLADLGNFDECLSARKHVLGKELRGKYFLMQASHSAKPIALYPQSSPRMTRALGANMGAQLSVSFGTCFPHVCSNEDVRNIFQTSMTTLANLSGLLNGGKTEVNKTSSMKPIYFNVRSSSTDNIDGDSYDVAAILAICIFSIIAVLMLLSSIYDYVLAQMDTPPNQLLIAFSIFTNGRKLFSIDTKASDNNIDCLNGIRVISMMWVIFGHLHFFTTFSPLINSIAIADWTKTPYSMLLQTAPVSVDSFLTMSGVLLAWVAIPKIEQNKGKLNIPLMYFHRYIRLTPVLAGAILFVVGILPLITEGPFASNFSNYISNGCVKNWWVTLLYVNNYVDPNNLCLNHTWYLSVDTQLFFISPFLLLGLWKWKSKFLWILLLLAALSYGCCISTMFANNLNDILIPGLMNPVRYERIYYPTHLRMPPWLIGMGFGYWLLSKRNKKPKLNVVQLMFGWSLAVALLMAVIFGLYHFPKNGTKATVLEAALYETLGRSAWSIGLIWIIFVCYTGNSSTINAFLSYPGWQPIVRLTYTMYISSFIVQTVNTANIKTDQYFSNYSVMQTYWADLGIVLTLSIFIVLALESPIIAIEKYFFVPKKPKVEATFAIEEGHSEK